MHLSWFKNRDKKFIRLIKTKNLFNFKLFVLLRNIYELTYGIKSIKY